MMVKNNTPSLFVGVQPSDQPPFSADTPMYCPEPTRWNRALYYSMPDPRLTQVHLNHLSMLDLNDVETQSAIGRDGGVWLVQGEHPDTLKTHVLDVHETVDIHLEHARWLRKLERADQTDWSDPLFQDSPSNFSEWKKLKCIAQWGNLRCLTLVVDDSLTKLQRELVEAQWAWMHKAVYWNRNYYQPVTAKAAVKQMQNQHISQIR